MAATEPRLAALWRHHHVFLRDVSRMTRAQSLLWTLTTPGAGLWSWLVLLPLGIAEDRAAARAEAAGGG